MSIYNYKELYEMWKESAPQTDDRVALNEDWGMFVDSLVKEGRVSELMWKYLPNTDEIPEDTQAYLEGFTECSVCPETYGEVKMKTYTLDIWFTMETDKEPEDWTSGQLQQALLERLNSLSDGELIEAVGIVEGRNNHPCGIEG